MVLDDGDMDEMVCTDCGALVDPRREPVFTVTAEIALCMECSIRRGGQWDGVDEKWVAAPKLDSLR
jgi:hypothetical protein